MGNIKMKKLILLMILLANAQMGFASTQADQLKLNDDIFGSCDDETDEEGNADWIDVSYIGPRDDPGCRNSDPIARTISIQITDFVGDGPQFNHAYLLESQPEKVISFSLALTNLLNKLENDKHVVFYEYVVASSKEAHSAVMNLQIEKRSYRRGHDHWVLTVNWPDTWHVAQQMTIPAGATHIDFDVILQQNYGLEYSQLNLFVEAGNLNMQLTHPNKFSLDTQVKQTHLGLISAELIPPVGDVLGFREALNP